MAVAPEPKRQYVDRVDVTETFADSVRSVTFDGATVRAELCVTRLEDSTPPTAAVAKQYPACRVVLRPDAAVDLFVRLQQLVGLMEQRGLIKRQQPTNASRQQPAEGALANPLGKGSKTPGQKNEG